MRCLKLILVLGMLPTSAVLAQDTELQPDALDDAVVKAKQEGVYYTGVPALASSPDSGFIYGVLLFRFDNGKRSDEKFAYTPYLNKTNLLAVQSTKGFNQFKLNADIPFAFGSTFRLSPALIYTKNISEQYFGSDAATMEDLKFPTPLQVNHDLTTPDDFESYQTELQKKRPNGHTYFRYNHYEQTELEISLGVERAYFSRYLFLGGKAAVRNVEVEDYSGQEVVALEGDNEETATMQTTKLKADRELGLVTAPEGSRIHSLSLFVRYDSRDFEPDPMRGIVAQASGLSSRQELGSSESYAKYSLLLKGYVSPIQSLTLAGQARYEWSEGDVPFFELPSVGGRMSLKGYRYARFRSLASSSVNAEVRWRAYTLGSTSQSFVFVPVGFADWGRVYDRAFTMAAEKWRRSFGAGLRVVWNQATVIAFEQSLSGEEGALYVNIDHIF